MDIKNLGCINPYTGLLTSKKVTDVKNRAGLDENGSAYDERLYGCRII